VTLEKFLAYEKVRQSGKTNRWDVLRVIKLTKGFLDREDCHDIMKHYSEYRVQWQADIEEAFK